MSKKCVCGNEMTREDWKHEWVCHRCGRKRPIPLPPMFTVFMCRKCEHLLYVEEDEDFPQKLGKIAAKSCPCCGEQEEGLWRLLGRVVDKLTREKMISRHDFERKEKHYE